MNKHKETFSYRVISSFLILSLISSGCISSRSNKNNEAGIQVVQSLKEEIQAGEQIHQEILSNFQVYTKPDVVQYVVEVGKAVTDHAERDDLPYRFTILYNDKIYATSAPGGFVYITTGMMNFLDNEAELAAILAHEIAQLQYRDPEFSKLRKAVSDFSQAGATVAPMFGQIGLLAVLGFILMHSAANGGGKDQDKKLADADELALTYLVEAGYDPQSMLDVLEKFVRADDQLIPLFYDYYQTRPVSEERFLRLKEEFLKLPLEDKSLSTRPRIYQEVTKPIREIYSR